jgi:hypothetical protein
VTLYIELSYYKRYFEAKQNKGVHNALDNICDTVGSLVIRDGFFLYTWRIYTHITGNCISSSNNQDYTGKASSVDVYV